MAQGRGSAALIITAVMLCLVVTEAAYQVGDSSGWTFNVAGWPKGKRFRSGDILVFKYALASHNVVVVDKAGYDTCKTPRGAKVYRSGRDQIKLAKGHNYFICNFPGHCESGMKIDITAT